MIGSAFEQHTSMQLKLGERVTFGMVSLGGFIEVRNEPHLNKGLIPNHNWRGYLNTSVSMPMVQQMQFRCSIIGLLEHESAYATIGATDASSSLYEVLYDHSNRKVNLNALRAGIKLYTFDQLNSLLFTTTFDGYLQSKNTPELPGFATAWSGGITSGAVYRYQFSNVRSLFLAVHERFIATSAQNADGLIYQNSTHHPAKIRIESYSIINKMNTFSLCCGMSMPLFRSRHLLEVYGRWLKGNCYGYVDSRDSRNVFALGVSITPK